MGVWNTATPAGSDPRSQGDDRIRELKTAIQESLRGGTTDGLEAVFPGAAPTTAPVFHYRGLKGTTAARPAALEGGLYFNTTTGTLQRADGSAWLDLTENAAYEAIHQAVGASLASVAGVATLPETGNSFNVSGTEAMTSLAGWSAGVVIIKWTQARTLTHGASFYLMEALSRVVSANDISVFEFTGSNAVREVAFHGAKLLPTRQTFTSGSGTYTTPAGCRQIIVRAIGGGGGSGGRGATQTVNPGAGGNSSFNSIVATGGGAGINNCDAGTINNSGGVGGTGGAGTATLRIAGGGGDGGNSGVNSQPLGGIGAFGGGGAGLNLVSATNAGVAGATNSGSGASAGGINQTAGSAGGAGEYIEIVINNPSATYSYAVGAGGTAGVASSVNGALGGSGVVIVDEIY